MSEIASLQALEVLDSRGNPTVEVEAILASGHGGRAIVPSGASTGSHEAHELRDGDAGRYHGQGVRRAVAGIANEIAPAVRGRDAQDQAGLDAALCILDGTPNKSRLGSNAVLGVSLAVARAAAAETAQPLYRYLGGALAGQLPVPLMNVINGGRHADNNLGVQEYMLAPVGADTFADALRCGSEVYRSLRLLLQARGLGTAVGDEGGFAPDLQSDSAALDLLVEAVVRAGYRPGSDVLLAIDLAASELLEDGRYRLDGQLLDQEGVVGLLSEWARRYPIFSIEDPFAEDDFAGFTALTEAIGDRIQIIGDDIFVTQPRRLEQGVREHAGNAILIKLNQVGTLTETVETIRLAQRCGFDQIISHRSGETDDATIADLAVAVGAGQIKTGAPARGERVAKYNQLLRIEHGLGASAHYAGRLVRERRGMLHSA